MRRRILSSVLFVIFSAILINAQSDDLKNAYLIADSYFLFEEYADALVEYLKINRADPDNDDVNYKIGICFLNDPYQKEKSIRYLEKASENINFKYKENNWREKSAPPETFFYLGNAYLVNNKIDKALENYKYFLEILDEDIYDVELVEAQIETCERAREYMNAPVDIDLINLGEKINDRYSDINPVISGNDSSMAYISERPFYDVPFYSSFRDREWQRPRDLIPELEVDDDVYPASLSYNGTTMIIYRDDDFIGNLYVSELKDGFWTPMKKLGDNINTKYWESHGSFSRDGQTLYFTSNRKGTNGGLDIYKSERLADGTWGEPANLGKAINTRFNEDTPFITENGKRLYFSSYGHNGMGGYDVFYSELNDNGVWGTPVNLGYPVNTTDDDLFFHPVNNGTSAYFSKYMEEGYGRHDIYYLNIYSDNNPRYYKVSGNLQSELDSISRKDDVITYIIERYSGDTLATTGPDLENQRFETRLTRGHYELVFKSKTYLELVFKIDIDDSSDKSGIDISDQLIFRPIPYEPRIFKGEDSHLTVKEDTIRNVLPGVEMEVSMDVIKGAKLLAELYHDSVLVTTDTFELNKKKFDYKFTPGDNMTNIDLTMVEENGDMNLTEIVVFAKERKTIVSEADESPEDKIEKEREEAEIQEELEQHDTIRSLKKEFIDHSGDEPDTTLTDIDPERPETSFSPAVRIFFAVVSALVLFLFVFYLRNRKNGKKDELS